MKTLLTIILLLIAGSVQAATQSILTVKSTGAIVAVGDASTLATIQARFDVPADYVVTAYTVYPNITQWDADQNPKLKTTGCAKLSKPEKAALGCP